LHLSTDFEGQQTFRRPSATHAVIRVKAEVKFLHTQRKGRQ